MKKKLFPIIIVLILLVLGGILAVPKIVSRYAYSSERADLSAYFGIAAPEEVPVLMEGAITDIKGRVKDGSCYLDFATVQALLNDRFYDGREDGTLIYTTPDAILTSVVGTAAWSASDGTGQEEPYVISFYEGERLFVALDYVRKYTNFAYELYAGPDRMELHVNEEVYPRARIKKDTKLRERGGVKSAILEDLHRDDTVCVLEEMETWSKVKTANAFIGYVENKRLEDAGEEVSVLPTDAAVFEYTSQFKPYKICLAWHNVAGEAGNDSLRELTESAKGLNTVSPTWYAISHDDGSIRSFASASYVREAHTLGLDVWALINDMDFKDSISDYAVFSTAEHRAGLIDLLMREADAIGFDGINIDFEYIDEATGESYIQFLRELSIACRQRGLVLSVDNYVPKEYNRQYHRKEQGVVADYVIIMGYDEHGTFSSEAGSVASLDFVVEGITKTLEEVPAEKVINAVPFYTRVWTTENGTLTSQALGIRQASDFITNHAMELSWNKTAGQNYAEKTEGARFYQIWMEDSESIAAKLSVMEHHNLAGVAAWKLGFEPASLWDTVAAYVQE